MVMELARAIAREKIAPVAGHHDETETYPEEVMRLLGQQGLMGIWVPEAYGGTQMGALAVSLVAEEVAWACAATATNWGATVLGGHPIVLAGTEEQKRRYLPRLATGELLAAYSLSEPGAGSDAAGLQTVAVRKGDRYVLNGTKLWCSNGSNAGVITLFATLDSKKGAKGITAFLVEPGFPGFAVGKQERKLGIRASPTVALHLGDCEVPVENRLGAEGEGFRIAMRTLDFTRPMTGATAVGVGQAALDAATDYAKERRQFNQPIAAFQGIQFMLADMAMQVHAARLMVHHVATLVDRGAPGDGAGGLDGQVLRRRRGDAGGDGRGPGLRGRRLHAGVPGRALHARRQDHADLRGDQPDPAGGDRPGAAGPPLTWPGAAAPFLP